MNLSEQNINNLLSNLNETIEDLKSSFSYLKCQNDIEDTSDFSNILGNLEKQINQIDTSLREVKKDFFKDTNSKTEFISFLIKHNQTNTLANILVNGSADEQEFGKELYKEMEYWFK